MTALRPLFALFNRSLREQSRMKFTSVSRAAIVLIILLCIVSNERNFVNHAAPGLEVLMMLVMVNFFTVTVFGLSTFSSAITEEKEEATLGLLRMTRLNPLAILLGKSTARLFDGLLLLAVQLPFTMLCVTLGGVAQSQILRSYAVLAAYLFFLCNVSLLWSVVCRRTSRAVSLTTLTGFVLYVLPMFLISLTMTRRFAAGFGGAVPDRKWYEAATEWLLSINPVFDLTRTVMPRTSGIPFASDSIGTSLVGGVIAFCLAWLLFGRFCNTTEEAAPSRKTKSAGNGSRRHLGAARPGNFAIAWKDFHFLGGGYRGILVRACVYAALVGLFVWWGEKLNAGSRRREVYGEILRIFGLVAFSIEMGLAGARIFGVERKRKTLGGLFALPLGTARLIGEKVLGTLPMFIPSFGLYVLGVFLIAGAHQKYPYSEPAGYALAEGALVASEYVYFAVLVTYLSLRMRRAALAAAMAVMFFGNMFASVLIPRSYYAGSGSYSESTVVGIIMVWVFIVWVFIVAIAAAIPGRIARAAAEE